MLLRSYVEEVGFTIRMDHDTLKYILDLTERTDRHAFWRLRLSESDFDLVHRADIKHKAVDALSLISTRRKATRHSKMTS